MPSGGSLTGLSQPYRNETVDGIAGAEVGVDEPVELVGQKQAG